MAMNAHVGSDFDEFLREEGVLEECAATGMKRVIAWLLDDDEPADGPG